MPPDPVRRSVNGHADLTTPIVKRRRFQADHGVSARRFPVAGRLRSLPINKMIRRLFQRPHRAVNQSPRNSGSSATASAANYRRSSICSTAGWHGRLTEPRDWEETTHHDEEPSIRICAHPAGLRANKNYLDADIWGRVTPTSYAIHPYWSGAELHCTMSRMLPYRLMT